MEFVKIGIRTALFKLSIPIPQEIYRDFLYVYE